MSRVLLASPCDDHWQPVLSALAGFNGSNHHIEREDGANEAAVAARRNDFDAAILDVTDPDYHAAASLLPEKYDTPTAAICPTGVEGFGAAREGRASFVLPKPIGPGRVTEVMRGLDEINGSLRATLIDGQAGREHRTAYGAVTIDAAREGVILDLDETPDWAAPGDEVVVADATGDVVFAADLNPVFEEDGVLVCGAATGADIAP